MIWAAMSSAGVGPLRFLKSTVNAAIYQEILEHFMPLPSIEYIYSKLAYFPEGQQFTKKNFFIGLMKYSNLLR